MQFVINFFHACKDCIRFCMLDSEIVVLLRCYKIAANTKIPIGDMQRITDLIYGYVNCLITIPMSLEKREFIRRTNTPIF